MDSTVNKGCKNSNTEKTEDRNRITNDGVINLFFSIFEEFSQKPDQVFIKVESIIERKQKLHDILCSKLGFPAGSVLKGNFHANCFKIEVVTNVEEDMVKENCDIYNLTYEYVFETYINLEQQLPGATVQERFDKLRQILCEKIGIVNEIIDPYKLKLKVLNKMSFLRRLKERKEDKKVEEMMESIFYPPVRNINLLKELQNRAENTDLPFLQKQNQVLTNGLLIDVFKAVNKDVKELRKVLSSQFSELTKLTHYTLRKTIIQTMDEAENLKESGFDGECREFMNQSPFGSLLPSFCTQETKGDLKEGKQNNCSQSFDNEGTSLQSLGSKSLQGVSISDTDVKDACTSVVTLEENQEPLLVLKVQTDCEIEGEKKKKRKAYDNAFKLCAVKYAERTSNGAAARKFGVGEKLVRFWRKSKDMILERPKCNKKNVSVPQNLVMLENDLCKWFKFNQKNGVVLGKKEVMAKGKVFAKHPKYNVNTSRHLFGSSWCNRFLKSNNLTLCRNKRKGTMHCSSKDETDKRDETLVENEENESQGSKDFNHIRKERKDPLDEDIMNSVDSPSIDTMNAVVENGTDNNSCQRVSLEVIGNASDLNHIKKEPRDPLDEDILNSVDTPSSIDTINAVVENGTDNNSGQRVSLEVIGNASDFNDIKKEPKSLLVEDIMNSVGTPSSVETINAVVENGTDNNSGQRVSVKVIGNTSDMEADKEMNNDLKEKKNADLKSAMGSYVSDSIQVKDASDEKPLQIKEISTRKGVKREYSNEETECSINNGEMKREIKKAKVAMVTRSRSKTSVNGDKGDKDRKRKKLEKFEDDLLLALENQTEGADISAECLLAKAKSLHAEEKYCLDFYDNMLSNIWAQQLLNKHKLAKETKDASEHKNINIETPHELSPKNNDESFVIETLEELDKKRPRQSYDLAFKTNVISFAESSSNNFAASVFNISETNVRSWRKSKESILVGSKGRKRCGYNVHPPYEELENDLALWCENVRKSGKRLITYQVINKASQLAKEGKYHTDLSQFQASRGWCKNFFKRKGLTGEDGRSFRGKKEELLQADAETVDADNDVDDDNANGLLDDDD